MSRTSDRDAPAGDLASEVAALTEPLAGRTEPLTAREAALLGRLAATAPFELARVARALKRLGWLRGGNRAGEGIAWWPPGART